MTHPVVPYSKVLVNDFLRYESIQGYKQQKPYDVPTGFTRKRSIMFFRGKHAMGPSANVYPFNDETNARYYRYAVNDSYERLIAKLGDNASWGSTLLAEGRETYGMLRDLAIRAYQATRAAKRGNALGVAQALGLPVTAKKQRVSTRRRARRTVTRRYITLKDGRTVAATPGNAWLLYSYGIAPLAGDIQTTMQVFVRDFPYKTIRGSTKETWSWRWPNPAREGYTADSGYERTLTMRQAVDVRVKNPNLHLARQLGLVNPFQVINEAVPFSFVIDWFSNWSSVIGQFSDFTGLETRDPRTTYVFTSVDRSIRVPGHWLGSDYDYERKYVQFSRTTSLSKPIMTFRLERFAWQRILNAMSLTVGILLSSTKK